MNLPTSQSVSDEKEAVSTARRRRDRRLPVPAAGASRDEHLAYLDELAERAIPSVDYYLLSILAGLAMGAGILFDSTPLIVLGAVLAPLTGPFLGLGLATIAGSGRFFLQSLGSALIAGLLVGLGAFASGWAGRFFFPLPEKFAQADLAVGLTTAAFAALTVAVTGTIVSFVRSSGRSVVIGAALTYLLFLPVASIGVGLAAGAAGYLIPAAVTFALYLAWAMLLSTLTLGILGMRPVNAMGYVLGTLVIFVSLAVLASFVMSNSTFFRPGRPVSPAAAAATIRPTAARVLVSTAPPAPAASPSGTPSSAPSATNTLVPTLTPSQTITPAPTPVWAIISAGSSNGAYIRSEPKFGGKILTSLLNGTLVQVLPATAQDSGMIWVEVKTSDGREGWIVQGLLVTATPAPGW